MKATVLSCIGWLWLVTPIWAANIAWIGMHPTDEPIPDSLMHGYTKAADQGYVDLLRGAGHTVTRFLTQSPTAAYIDTIDDADLVIISRQIGSGDYQDDPERELWHGVTKPMMFMSGYALRNNRLQLMSGDTIPDTSAAGPITLTATVPSHAIFDGVTLDASNNMTFANYPISTPNGVAQRGISVVTDPIAGGGTVLATVGTPGDPAFDGMLIGHWPTGSIAGSFTVAAPRMAFLSGNREPVEPDNQIPIAGVKDLTSEGDKLFLNSVCFMVGGCGPPLVTGDTDGNGTVDIADFEPIRANFRKTVATRGEGDLVSNGVVDFADFREWKAAFTGAGGSLAGLDLSFGTNVPEPSAIGLVLIGLCGLALKSRPRRGVVQ